MDESKRRVVKFLEKEIKDVLGLISIFVEEGHQGTCARGREKSPY
jgi:hypothetical protein